MKAKAFISLFVWGLFFSLMNHATAETVETPLRMEELTIQIMPEHSYHPRDQEQDHPPLLVGYHGALMNISDTPQKGQIAIPLPVNDEGFRIGFVADYSSDLTEMNEIEYQLDKETGTISWTTSAEILPQELYRFVIEYYTDSIEVHGDTRTLSYQFTGFAEIGMLNLMFIEPMSAGSFTLTPAAESHQKNSYNMNMFIYPMQSVGPGEEKTIELEYDRADSRTTSEIFEAMASGMTPTTAGTKNEDPISGIMIASVLGGVTILVAVVLMLLLRKKSQAKHDNNRPQSVLGIKKAKLRSMLLEKKITEEEYQQLLKTVGGKEYVKK